MYALKIRDVTLGQGRPKICIPVMGKDKEEILRQARIAAAAPSDLIEFRADAFAQILEKGQISPVWESLRLILGDKPLLFTFRTSHEGGERAISFQDYESLLKTAADSGFCDVIDVEVFMDGWQISERIRELITHIQGKGAAVLASNHDFVKTPEEGRIVERLRAMDKAGADILKMAVMPHSREDVLTLLKATVKVRESDICKPLVTMSMGDLGLVSRLCGETFGADMTFGTGAKASAPGQMEALKLQEVLEAIHQTMSQS